MSCLCLSLAFTAVVAFGAWLLCRMSAISQAKADREREQKGASLYPPISSKR